MTQQAAQRTTQTEALARLGPLEPTRSLAKVGADRPE